MRLKACLRNVQDLIVDFYGYRVSIQGDQLNMAEFCWCLVKSDLSSVRYCTRVHWTSHIYQGTKKHCIS